jgi:hypothetical protein
MPQLWQSLLDVDSIANTIEGMEGVSLVKAIINDIVPSGITFLNAVSFIRQFEPSMAFSLIGDLFYPKYQEYHLQEYLSSELEVDITNDKYYTETEFRGDSKYSYILGTHYTDSFGNDVELHPVTMYTNYKLTKDELNDFAHNYFNGGFPEKYEDVESYEVLNIYVNSNYEGI